MKKNESIIRAMKLEGVRFRFRQLSRNLFFDGYVRAEIIDQSEKRQLNHQVVYINQHTCREYSFPGISFRER
jgi:hypothetical protein